jgi:hypothetical protein
MPISVKTINDRMLANLDAEGSERYLFDQDIKPAINNAMEVLISMFNAAFAENKLSPESLRDLVKVKIWQTNKYSRVSYNSQDTGHPFWTILAVYPKPKVNKGVAASPVTDPSESKFRGDLSFIESEFSAKRLTLEQWNENKKNVFFAGNETLKGALEDYAYLDFADYSSTSYTGNPGQTEIQIRPNIPNELVAISYLKYPNQVLTINDTIEFPESLTSMIMDISLNYISYKQGDATTLYQVTERNIVKLINLIR